MAIELGEISGIGEKTVSKIVAEVGEEQLDDFLLGLEKCEFRFLFSLGLDSRVVNEIVKYSYAKKFGFSYSDGLVQSPVIAKLLNEILGSVRKRFVLDANCRKLIGFYPTADLKEIGRRQDIVRRAVDFYSQYDVRRLKEMRTLLKAPVQKKVFKHEIVVLCDEIAVYEELKEGLPKEVLLVRIASLEEFSEYAGEEFIRYAYTSESKFVSEVECAENVEVIKFKGVYSVVPELLLYKYQCEAVFLEATLVLIEEYGVSCDAFEREVLSAIVASLEEEIGSGSVSGALVLTSNDVEEFCKKVENAVEEKLSGMQISGRELLGLLKADVSSHALLSQVINDVKKEFSSDASEREMLKYLDFSLALPSVDAERILEMEKEQALSLKRRTYLSSKDFAGRFFGKLGIIESCKTFLEQVDFLLGLGETFSGALMPKIVSSGRFRCLELKSFVMKEKGVDVQAISYYLDRSQTIVTGANSGGKTSLLHLIAESQLLSMMGLYVFGEVELPLYSEIHFFKKSNGTVGSGAFETTLRSFANIATREAQALLLIDEIESITEPGAAGRLIAGTLEWLSSQAGKDVVLVSHLGDVLSELCPQARIDGIEASHLGSDLELVVDRNPKIGVIAKSTPQLIVEKLARVESGNEYFSFLLGRMGV